MSINAVVVSEAGKRLSDVSPPLASLTSLLTSTSLDAYPMVSGIDPYGDTTFNQIQILRLVDELRHLRDELPASDADVQILLELAQQALDGVHCCLRIFGD